MAALTDAALIESVRDYTRSGPLRLQAMIDALRLIEANNIPGDIVECGVWRGGHIILARTICPDRVCWLYDTFAGMTEPDEVLDMNRGGGSGFAAYKRKEQNGHRWLAASIAEVSQCLTDVGVFEPIYLRFVRGNVCETLKLAAQLPEQIALLHLDTDWYASTKAELEALYPRLTPGGVLIIDDYGHWMGARKAVDEYFGGTAALQSIDYTGVMLIKPC